MIFVPQNCILAQTHSIDVLPRRIPAVSGLTVLVISCTIKVGYLYSGGMSEINHAAGYRYVLALYVPVSRCPMKT